MEGSTGVADLNRSAMTPLFAVSVGITLFCLSGIYWALFDSRGIQLEALLGSITGAMTFGSAAYYAFLKMMDAENVDFLEERKWLENAIRTGMHLSDVKNRFGESFRLMQEAPGFSPLHGKTMVYDYSSVLSSVRIVTRDDLVLTVRVEVRHKEDA